MIRYSLFLTLIISNFFIFAREFTPLYEKKDIEKLKQEIALPEYSVEVLPYDLSHCIALLNLARELPQDIPLYLRSVCKMYNNLIKQTAFLDAEMFVDFMNQFFLTMQALKNQKQQFSQKLTRQSYQTKLYEQLFGAFSAHYHQFKVDPEFFLHNISADLTTMTFSYVDDKELEQAIVRLFEQALSKLLWNGDNHDQSWNTTKKIADLLMLFADNHIVSDVNDVDDLLWSLLSRYDYFLTMFADTLSIETAQRIKTEIEEKKLSFSVFDQSHQAMSKSLFLLRNISAILLKKEDRLSDKNLEDPGIV